jgi:Flp pilus assembly protein TadG
MRRARGRHAQRGAALVEAAIIIPVLFLIVFAVIDFGNVFYQYISVREGAREAAITTIPGDGTWGSCSLAAGNNVPAGAANRDFVDMMCYTKSRIGLGMGSNVRVSIAWSSLNPPNTATGSDWVPSTSPSATDSLIVCAQFSVSSLTGALSPILGGKVVTSKTEIRIEQPSLSVGATTYGDLNGVGAGVTSPIQEPALTSWPSSCTSP